MASCGNIQDYVRVFRQQIAVLGDTKSREDYIFQFVRGLPRFLRTGCKMHFAEKPEAEVDEYFGFVGKFAPDEVSAGVAAETKQAQNKKRGRNGPGNAGPSGGGNRAVRQRLSDEEYARRKANNECFTCGKTGHRQNECHSNKNGNGNANKRYKRKGNR